MLKLREVTIREQANGNKMMIDEYNWEHVEKEKERTKNKTLMVHMIDARFTFIQLHFLHNI